VREHDGVYSFHGGKERLGPSQVTDDNVHAGRGSKLGAITHQGPNGMSDANSFIDDVSADAAGRSDSQHSDSRLAHVFSPSTPAAGLHEF
jgi:hypothetical protein